MTTSTRDRLLDAAMSVMRERGLARSTTKEVAAAAGCSEALLYKHFADKQDLFVRVLAERLPPIGASADRAGTRTVASHLHEIVEDLLAFYVRAFPIAASVFSDPGLLAAHRESMATMGVGPHVPAELVREYLDAEVDTGRVGPGSDTAAVALALTGAALYRAFLAAFAGADDVDDAGEVARDVVAAVLPALAPDPD